MGKTFKDDSRFIFGAFVGIIMFAVLLGSIADQNVAITTTSTATNVTVTAPNVNASTDLTGRTLISQTGVNITHLANNASNFTNGIFLRTAISNTTGLQTVQVVTNDTGAAFAGDSVNVSYTYQADGYLPSSASRNIVAVILILAALAILIFVIVRLVQTGSFKNVMRFS